MFEVNEQNVNDFLQQADKGEVPGLKIGNLFEKVETEEVEELLSELCKRIQLNYSIILEGLEIVDIGRKLYQGYSTVEISKLLFGESRRNCVGHAHVISILEKNGFVIEDYRFHNDRYYISAKRTKIQ